MDKYSKLFPWVPVIGIPLVLISSEFCGLDNGIVFIASGVFQAMSTLIFVYFLVNFII